MIVNVDLSLIHNIVSFTGLFLSVYVMQLSHFDPRHLSESWVIHEAQRAGLTGFALSLCWSLVYSENRQWTPWPPDLVAFGMIDFLLAVRLTVICINIRRAGLKWWSPSLMWGPDNPRS